MSGAREEEEEGRGEGGEGSSRLIKDISLNEFEEKILEF